MLKTFVDALLHNALSTVFNSPILSLSFSLSLFLSDFRFLGYVSFPYFSLYLSFFFLKQSYFLALCSHLFHSSLILIFFLSLFLLLTASAYISLFLFHSLSLSHILLCVSHCLSLISPSVFPFISLVPSLSIILPSSSHLLLFLSVSLSISVSFSPCSISLTQKFE